MSQGATHVALADLDAVADQLRRFADGEGAVEVDADSVVATVGSATLTVTDEGTVTASMPRHEFHASGVDEVVVDHDRGAVGVSAAGGDVCYEFRRPG